MLPIVSVHYAELGLKGANRPDFERRLREEIQKILGPLVSRVRLSDARFVGELAPGTSPESVSEKLGRVFGVAWWAFGWAVARTPEALVPAALAVAQKATGAKTFRVEARRSDKTFPQRSEEIGRSLGAVVQQATGWKVNLSQPDTTVAVEILTREALVLGDKHPGLRGLPQGISGRVVTLLSGGIDSPVAAWLMMGRGLRVDLLHFHPYRNGQEVAGTKMGRMYERLRDYQADLKLFLIPFDRYQVAASLGVDPSCETVFFRRYMFRVAEEFAKKRGAGGLVTGDSLGQVASQTLENLTAAQVGLTLPLFQPLIAMDKDQIIRLAQRIGTYAPSIEPYKDCCSLLSPKPRTRVPTALIQDLESKLNLPALVQDSLASLEEWGTPQTVIQ